MAAIRRDIAAASARLAALAREEGVLFTIDTAARRCQSVQRVDIS